MVSYNPQFPFSQSFPTKYPNKNSHSKRERSLTVYISPIVKERKNKKMLYSEKQIKHYKMRLSWLWRASDAGLWQMRLACWKLNLANSKNAPSHISKTYLRIGLKLKFRCPYLLYNICSHSPILHFLPYLAYIKGYLGAVGTVRLVLMSIIHILTKF